MNRRAACVLLLVLAGGVAWLLADGAEDTHRTSTPPEPATRSAEPDMAGGTEAAAPAPTLEPAPGVRPVDEPTWHAQAGRVMDTATGRGIEGVQVHCVARGANREEGPHARMTVSGVDGEFSIDGLTAGTWLIVPFHKDYTHRFLAGLFRGPESKSDAWRHSTEETWAEARRLGLVFDVADDATPLASIELKLERGPAIRGRVVGPGDEPVKGAPIRVHVPYYSPWMNLGGGLQQAVAALTLTRTDGDGRFSIACFLADLRSVRLGAWAQGLIGQWSEPLDLAANEEIELRLFEPAIVEGHVRWSDGRPAPAASVHASVDDLWIVAPGRLLAETDNQGRFRLEGLPPATVVLTAHAADRRDGRADLAAPDLQPGEVRRGLALTLNDQQMIRGVLVSAEGTPLEHECIIALCGDDEEDSSWTDKDGQFRLLIETDDPVELRLITGNRDELLIKDLHPPISDLRVTTTESPYVTLTVRVFDPDGNPIPRFVLAAGPADSPAAVGRRAKEGSVSINIQGAPPYHYRVWRPRDADGKKLTYASYGAELTSLPTGPIDVRLSDTAEFHGRILDLEDEPVPGVRLLIDEGSGEREIPVAQDGRYRFTANDPAVRTIIEGRLILPKGYRDWTFVPTLSAGRYEDIRVRGGGLPIKGRVVLKGGGTASLDDLGIQLSWTSAENNEDDTGREITTDAEGNFVLYALPEDAEVTVNVHEYSLSTRGLLALNGPLVVPAGTTDIVLEVRLGATIRGRVEGPGVADLDYGELGIYVLPWHGFIGRFYDQSPPTAKSRAFSIAGLEDQRYRLALLDTRGSPRLLGWVDEVEAGRSNVVLRLPRLTGVVEGTVDLQGLKNVESIWIAVWYQDGSNYFIATEASEDGRFRADRLNPAGRYALRVLVRTESAAFVAVRPNVQPGQPVHLQPKPGLSIRGRVKGHRRGSGVVAVLATANGVSHFADFSEDDGTFELTDLAKGTYELTVLKTGFVRARSVKGVRAGSSGVLLPGD